MEQKILAIVDKVRNMYRFDKRYKAILETKPNIMLGINDEGNLELESISWNYYDAIYASNEQIALHPEYGSNATLIEYNGWDELLAL